MSLTGLLLKPRLLKIATIYYLLHEKYSISIILDSFSNNCVR